MEEGRRNRYLDLSHDLTSRKKIPFPHRRKTFFASRIEGRHSSLHGGQWGLPHACLSAVQCVACSRENLARAKSGESGTIDPCEGSSMVLEVGGKARSKCFSFVKQGKSKNRNHNHKGVKNAGA